MTSLKQNTEREGFEPSVPDYEHNCLAGSPIQPLSHLSQKLLILKLKTKKMAEREGFEPPELAFNGFQDHRLRPLGHLSVDNNNIFILYSQLNLRCEPRYFRRNYAFRNGILFPSAHPDVRWLILLKNCVRIDHRIFYNCDDLPS